jgi:hypothetical protein
VMRILNSEEKEATGVSPAELLFGNAINLDRGLFTSAPSRDPDLTGKSISQWMDKMLKQQTTLLQVARETQQQRDAYHMSEAEPGFTEFPVNSYVLLDPPAGSNNKMEMRYKGPYKVVNFVGSAYSVQNLVNHKMITTHITNLRPFFYDPRETDPMEVALQNEEEFFIETILAHRGDRTRRKTMEFKVHWKGESIDDATWEPYSNLRDTDQLLDYLRKNKLKTLINAKHK